MSIRLFIGNLSYDVTEAELRELFSAAGPPTQVRLGTDRETGKPRGFAFVDFADRAQGEDAIQRFNQHQFKGRALAVNEARAREARPAGGGAPRPAARSSAPPRPSRPTGFNVPGGDEDVPMPGQPRRTFGPDAASRGKRKGRGGGSREERGPRGPMKERGGGQLFSGSDFEDEDDDQGLDDFALWAREDAKNKEEDKD